MQQLINQRIRLLPAHLREEKQYVEIDIMEWAFPLTKSQWQEYSSKITLSPRTGLYVIPFPKDKTIELVKGGQKGGDRPLIGVQTGLTEVARGKAIAVPSETPNLFDLAKALNDSATGSDQGMGKGGGPGSGKNNGGGHVANNKGKGGLGGGGSPPAAPTPGTSSSSSSASTGATQSQNPAVAPGATQSQNAGVDPTAGSSRDGVVDSSGSNHAAPPNNSTFHSGPPSFGANSTRVFGAVRGVDNNNLMDEDWESCYIFEDFDYATNDAPIAWADGDVSEIGLDISGRVCIFMGSDRYSPSDLDLSGGVTYSIPCNSVMLEEFYTRNGIQYFFCSVRGILRYDGQDDTSMLAASGSTQHGPTVVVQDDISWTFIPTLNQWHIIYEGRTMTPECYEQLFYGQ